MVKKKYCKPAEKIRQPESEDGSAGGVQGEECRAVRASKPRRLFVRTEASREVFFSLIEKNFRGRAKEKIVKKTSLLDTRAKRAAAGRERTIWFRATTRSARGQSGFCSKKVRISSNRHHQSLFTAQEKKKKGVKYLFRLFFGVKALNFLFSKVYQSLTNYAKNSFF
mgnify:CR=1 FL=1